MQGARLRGQVTMSRARSAVKECFQSAFAWSRGHANRLGALGPCGPYGPHGPTGPGVGRASGGRSGARVRRPCLPTVTSNHSTQTYNVNYFARNIYKNPRRSKSHNMENVKRPRLHGDMGASSCYLVAAQARCQLCDAMRARVMCM